MAKKRKNAAELAKIIRGHLGEATNMKIAVYFDKALGWHAKVYSADLANQARVDAIVNGLRETYELEQEWRH